MRFTKHATSRLAERFPDLNIRFSDVEAISDLLKRNEYTDVQRRESPAQVNRGHNKTIAVSYRDTNIGFIVEPVKRIVLTAINL